MYIVASVIHIWRGPRFLKPFADEVQDAGDALIVRRSGDKMRIALADIVCMETHLMGATKFITSSPCAHALLFG